MVPAWLGAQIVPSSLLYKHHTWFSGILLLPDLLESIGTFAFNGCSGLVGPLTIPNLVTSIAYAAFYNCTGFNGILKIPNSVNSIGPVAFSSCYGFTEYYLYPTTAPNVEPNSFGSFAKPLHIKAGATGYNVAPWTNTSIFSSIIADL